MQMKENEVNVRELFLLHTLLTFFLPSPCPQPVLGSIASWPDTLAVKRERKVSQNSKWFYQL